MKDTFALDNFKDSIVLKPSNNELKSSTVKVLNEKTNSMVSNDTIFTVLVTLSVFITGIIIDRLIKSYEKGKNKKRIRKHFVYYKNRISNDLLPRLVEGYKKFYQIISIDAGILKTPPKFLTEDFKRFINLDTKELLFAFNYNKNISEILSLVDYVENLTIANEKYHDSILLTSNDIRTTLSKQVEDYFYLLAEYTEIEKQSAYYSNDPAWQLINSSIFLYYDEYAGKRTLTKFYKNILRPIQETLIKLKYHKTKPIANKITELGKAISLRYNDLRILTIEVKCEYRFYYKSLDDICAKLKEYQIEEK